MLEVLINFICSLIMSLSGFYVIRKLINSDEKILKVRNILLIILASIITVLIHALNHNGVYSISIYILNIIIYKIIFNLKIEDSLIASGILMFLMFVGDLLISSIYLNFFPTAEIKNVWYLYISTNILVATTEIIIVKVNFFIKHLQTFYNNITKNKSISNVIFIVSLILGLSFLAYNVTKITKLNMAALINMFIMIIFFCITYIFIKSKNNYNELSSRYDNLFTYVQNFEDWIEKEQLNRHEYKNQLAVLRCLTKEKKVKEKIDEILEDSINVEGEVVHQLKALPKGGLKGLMYYKAAIAQKNKINLTVNVSIEIKSILNKLSEQDIRILCKLIGIYFDNAIEAAKETRKKIVSVEIYELKDKVNIVFSNTFKQHKNFKDRNKKGVSSKGEGHGNGLYFASKLITKTDWLEDKQEVIDRYYIQQLTIKKK